MKEITISTEPSVLIVDDDDDTCSNVRDILEEFGCRADAAHDGPSALKLVARRSYDVALLDFKMPGMDGAALFEQIKRLRPEIVAIMITAHAGSDGIQRAIDAGTWKILSKPVDMDNLLSLIRHATK